MAFSINTAERGIRPAIKWRNICFGNQSEKGERLHYKYSQLFKKGEKNMLSIEITKDAEQRVREILRENDAPCVRVRSFTVGQA